MLGVGEVLGVVDAVGVGVALAIETPLSQTSFFPDLIQVYFFPFKVLCNPALEQVAPAFGVTPFAGFCKPKIATDAIVKITIFLVTDDFIFRLYFPGK